MANAPSLSDAHDPETLVGPLLHLFTRLARHQDAALAASVQARLVALAKRPDVEIELRLAAEAIALEPGDLVAGALNCAKG